MAETKRSMTGPGMQTHTAFSFLRLSMLDSSRSDNATLDCGCLDCTQHEYIRRRVACPFTIQRKNFIASKWLPLPFPYLSRTRTHPSDAHNTHVMRLSHAIYASLLCSRPTAATSGESLQVVLQLQCIVPKPFLFPLRLFMGKGGSQ